MFSSEEGLERSDMAEDAQSHGEYPVERNGRARAAFLLLSLIGVAYGSWSAFRIRWVCDDAFITFRYIQNLLTGHGLVYNVGERVEGYTHFLWLSLIAILRRVGFEPIAITQVIGLLAYIGTLVIFAAASYRLFRRYAPLVPLTTLILAIHFDFKVWATGGLETSLFTFLVSAAFFVICISNLRYGVRLPLTGLLLTLGMMTRPDGVVFYVIVLVFVVVRMVRRDEQGTFVRNLILFNAPLVLVFLPYMIWKTLYYGSILPNTYYAKSGGGAYYSQGFFYVWLYLKAYISSALAVAGFIALISVIVERKSPDRDTQSAALVMAIMLVAGYIVLFVARVGGDFMYARFLHPVIPLIYFGAEAGLRRFLGRRRWLYLVISALVLLSVVHEKSRRDGIYFEEDGTSRSSYGPRGVADEHWYWSHKSNGNSLIERYEEIGGRLAGYFEGEKVTVLLGGQASLGYYGQFSECIEYAGLTDAYIAHLPIEKRGRPGHEKGATMDYVAERGVHFVFMKAPFKHEFYRLAYFRVGEGAIRAEMMTYDRELMRRLHARFPDAIDYVDFELYLDGWIEGMPDRPVDDVAAEYLEFRDFYFRHNPDPKRERRIISYLQATQSHPRDP